MGRSSLVFTLLCASGCLHVQRPSTLTIAPAAGVGAVARALALSGHPPTEVRESVGLVVTEWVDTGYRYGAVDGLPATVVRRYLAVVAPHGVVTLRAELKQCPSGGFTIGSVTVRGACQALDGIPEALQQELDALSRDVDAHLPLVAAGRRSAATHRRHTRHS